MKTRYIAHITIEADTPLKVGSSESNFMHDSPVQRDWNGLPMILGTSIAGVLRKDFKGDANVVFGKEDGSKVIFSNALLLDETMQVNEGLLLSKSTFLAHFDKLPIREHTAITEKGVAKKHGKFDEEVVYKGSRFRFSIEMIDDKAAFDELMALLHSTSFRLGGGSTKGFGKFKVIQTAEITLDTAASLAAYSSSLNSLNEQMKSVSSVVESNTHVKYEILLKPDDFFMFGAGFGDEEAKQIAVTEKIVDYNKKDLSENYLLMPASSIKGAIAHRAAYHYNLQNKHFIGDDSAKVVLGDLFGEAKNSKEKKGGSKGKVLFSDLFMKDENQTKIFDHVAIDRFTGGGLDSALFNEKTSAQQNSWKLEIMLEKSVDDVYVDAFEKTLDDLVCGMLPLGGATTKGHGIFTGEWSKA
jgi:CRISPR/Cas system CMR subunit Cmr4 (Cas7 group RAMP superfamily)